MSQLILQIPYIPAAGPSRDLPFERFLPLDQPGMVAGWLDRTAKPGALILDPLGSSPAALLEGAAAGYLVLAACNNPVIAFELRMLASAPTRVEFTSVIGELAALKKGDERLEISISSLYLTHCASCGKEIQASGYLWRRGESVPFSRIYTCERCGDSGEHPITDEDIQRLEQITRGERLHRARALERVLGGEVDDRESVEAAISIYPVRALYILFTMMNKLEGMRLPERRRELLEALILSLLDAGNAIWAWPEERERPRQLSVPNQYLEKNLWMELANATETWCSRVKAVELTTWPDMPAGPGICLYPGRVRDLAAAAKGTRIDKLMCVFPRPNQAFWTLCSLWASWLWGKQKASGFSQVIERRRFDWHWHTSALHSALLPAAALAGENVPMFGLVPEPAAGLMSSVIQSAAISGFRIQGCAVKNLDTPIQLEWKTGLTTPEFQPVNMQRTARDVMRELLNEIGEPTEHIELHTAAMCALAEVNAFPPSIQQYTYEKAAETQAMLNGLLADPDFLRRMNATAQDPESGLWWLVEADPSRPSLADILENEIVTWLRQENELPLGQTLERLYQRFPGFLTPPDDLVCQCLESYAGLNPGNNTWKLKPHETAAAREQNIEEMRQLVDQLAAQLQVEQTGVNPVSWSIGRRDSTPFYRILLLSSAIIDRDMLANPIEGCRNVVVIPGSRAGLMKFKIDRDPYLRELVARDYHFLKYRTLRSIAARTDLTLEVWQVLIDSDPLSLEETTQLSMFR